MLQPLDSEAPFIIYLDFKSPYAYLAIEPTRRLLSEVGLIADWRPFVLDIPSYLGSAKLGKSGKVAEQNRSPEQWSGVKYAYFDCRRYANLRDVTVRGTVKIWDTNLVATTMFWVKQQESLAEQCKSDSLLMRFLDRVFVPFWKRELDVESVAQMDLVLTDIGASSDGFSDFVSGEGSRANQIFQTECFNSGIYGVPTFVIPGSEDAAPEIFFGREHLPRLRWELTGRNGPQPDIAYESGPEKPSGIQGEERSLVVCVDFKSAESFLAIEPTIKACKEREIEIDWRIIKRPPLKEHTMPSDTSNRGEMHRFFRSRYIARDLARYAAVELSNIYDEERSDWAHLGLLWLQEVGEKPMVIDRYIQLVFQRYWVEGRSIDTSDSISEILQSMDFDARDFLSYLEKDSDLALLSRQEIDAELSVMTTPTYFVSGEPYQGRQHLPLLMGRLG